MINREKGAGSRVLLDENLKLLGFYGSQIIGYEDENQSHLALASAVGRGEADVAVGTEKIARQVDNIDFVPMKRERYDLVVNVDSLTEIGRVAADQYWSAIEARADKFLSINHEANEFTVAHLISEARHIRASRTPYWMRRGFVEEVVEFAPQR